MQEGRIIHIESDFIVAERRTYFMCKRLMDLVLTIIALIVTAPMFLIIALMIKIDSSGPVLFKQVRLGKGGRPFVLYKFRTMYHNADPEVHRQYVQSFIRNELPRDRSLDGSTPPIFKLVNDQRVTLIGHLLRRTSLDELPQFFNVITGDMSLVGPRPPLLYEVQEYQQWHKRRLETIPGITGLWQVRGRSSVDFDEVVRMDLEYIARQSLWLDLKIMLLTIPAVISGNGAK